MPALPPPRRLWPLHWAIAWRLQRVPACTPRQALQEFQDLTADGAARIVAVAESANPLWPEDRQKKYEHGNIGARVVLPTDLLAEVYFELVVDETGAPVDFLIIWKRGGILAFSAPCAERNPLIVAWVALLDQGREAAAAPPEPVDPEVLYRNHIKTDAQHDEHGPWFPWPVDRKWAQAQEPPIPKRRLSELRKDNKTGRRGRHKKVPTRAG